MIMRTEGKKKGMSQGMIAIEWFPVLGLRLISGVHISIESCLPKGFRFIDNGPLAISSPSWIFFPFFDFAHHAGNLAREREKKDREEKARWGPPSFYAGDMECGLPQPNQNSIRNNIMFQPWVWTWNLQLRLLFCFQRFSSWAKC